MKLFMLLWWKVLDKWLTLFNMRNITLWILYILNSWLIYELELLEYELEWLELWMQ